MQLLFKNYRVAVLVWRCLPVIVAVYLQELCPSLSTLQGWSLVTWAEKEISF